MNHFQKWLLKLCPPRKISRKGLYFSPRYVTIKYRNPILTGFQAQKKGEFTMAEPFSLICEHTVKKPPSRAKQVLFCALYILLVLISYLFGMLLKAPIPFVAVGLLLSFALFRLTWRYTRIAYEYLIEGDSLTFSVIYGGVSRKIIFTKPITELVAVECYKTRRGEKKLADYRPENEYFALLSRNESDSPDPPSNDGKLLLWYCLFEDENKKHCAFYFEMTEKAYRIFKSLNPTNTAPWQTVERGGDSAS